MAPDPRLAPLLLPVGAEADRTALTGTLRAELRRRRDEVNRRDREAWTRIQSRQEWEAFLQPRIEALRRSLGQFPAPPAPLAVHLAHATGGKGYRIECLTIESRPGLMITANLYLPDPLPEKLPGILLVHSHHNPRFQGELQDMGALWARAGCYVLVPDQLDYGERRQHPAGSRQEYRYRYVNGLQLLALGDSLMGWMVWDLQRCLDVLLTRSGIDRGKVIAIGSVAGGGDPVAVLTALDRRVTCAIPFNFGGPQPETAYPLPEDAETSFNYMGGAYWETTRNLAFSGRDGFLHWEIVGATAPRALIYGHEFRWDQERDPVWKRLQRLYTWYGVPDQLGYTHGAGSVSGRPPEATHCNNVGEAHRRRIHPLLERWFGIPAPTEQETRHPTQDLLALPDPLKERLGPRPTHSLYAEIAAERGANFRRELAARPKAERIPELRRRWAGLLGRVEPPGPPSFQQTWTGMTEPATVRGGLLEVEPGVRLPVRLLEPRAPSRTPRPTVVALTQEGCAALGAARSPELLALLQRGIRVCLPEVRGTGETHPGGGRGFQSEGSSLAVAEWMLGETLLGARIRDLRAVLRWLSVAAPGPVALWGDSLAEP
ncbi:MAG: hypothetical protein FJX77_00735, partial [Armatimonadetes bacterium]|nr:hypothetical protein [Armatimonadota bacterium]